MNRSATATAAENNAGSGGTSLAGMRVKTLGMTGQPSHGTTQSRTTPSWRLAGAFNLTVDATGIPADTAVAIGSVLPVGEAVLSS